MKMKRAQPPGAAALRRHAEARLRESRQRAAALPAAEVDTRHLVHELEVHQIELEMQNQELVRSRAEVEAGLKQYTDLYEIAPVGYFTLSRDGAIRRVNLTGAALLGMERAWLATRRFGLFVSAESRPAFNALLEKAFEGRRKETCEAALGRDGIELLWAHIDATCSEDNQECHIAVVDITGRKRAEQAIKDSRAYSDGIVNTIREPLLVLSTDLRVLSANRSFYQTFKVKPEMTDGQLISDLGNREWNIPRLRKLLEELLVDGTAFDGLEVESEFPIIGRRTMLLNARKIRAESNSTDMLLLGIEDITERKTNG
jgi:PAS domain S-box-containing protein